VEAAAAAAWAVAALSRLMTMTPAGLLKDATTLHARIQRRASSR